MADPYLCFYYIWKLAGSIFTFVSYLRKQQDPTWCWYYVWESGKSHIYVYITSKVSRIHIEVGIISEKAAGLILMLVYIWKSGKSHVYVYFKYENQQDPYWYCYHIWESSRIYIDVDINIYIYIYIWESDKSHIYVYITSEK